MEAFHEVLDVVPRCGARERIMRHGFGVVAGAMIIEVVAVVGVTSLAFARGGYGPPKPPTPFAAEELRLVEKCRAVAQTDGMDSPPFLRQCSAVRSYIYY
jgi:hypothetical protein